VTAYEAWRVQGASAAGAVGGAGVDVPAASCIFSRRTSASRAPVTNATRSESGRISLAPPRAARVPAPARVRQVGDESGGFRAPAPRHRAAPPGVEELRHYHPVAPDQRLGLLPLPRPRRHRVLPVLRRHPPVKREPQTSPRRSSAGGDSPVRAENLCHQVVFMNHASGAVAPPDTEVIQVGNAI